ncbi:MAG TPA: glucose-6-phosphate isomerase [Thermoanaerobaculia bacterium]|nr:glucose-6-phosphate isomerase [Thermoanaerobaculia bacterium]
MERIWSGDATLWKSDPGHRSTIENALGWLTIADRMAASLPRLEELSAGLFHGTERVLVLGMGGSSLAPFVFASSFPRRPGFPRLEVLDSTEPSTVLAAAESAPPERSIYVVSSKSGTTLEPNLFFDWFFAVAEKELAGRAGERFVVVTDPGTPLEKVARDRGVRAIVPGDPAIGGRYSALSAFGIVPAALAGIDVGEMLRRARAAAAECREPAPDRNPGASLGAAIGALALERRDKLTFSVGAPVDRFGMWLEQLIAESTGKEGKGVLPVEGEPLGAPEVYGEDRFFVRISPPGAPDPDGSLAKLAGSGHPVAWLEIPDALELGAEMFRWEFATAIAGALVGIDPFDQPNVQEAKDRTNEILGGKGGAAAEEPPSAPDPNALAKLIDSIAPGDYFAITAYLPPTPENEERLARIRLPVRDAKRVATTVGFGPRFLHSTGQFHKGGPETGVFLQITTESLARVAIPGRPWGFGPVISAQAAGDLAALRSRGRRALSVRIAEPGAGLTSLAGEVERAAGVAR